LSNVENAAVDASSGVGSGSSSGGNAVAGGTTLTGISVSLVRTATIQDVGVVSVTLPHGTATAGTGFAFALPEQLAQNVGQGAVTVTVSNGQPLPAWLKYVPETKTLVASAVPDGAFPMEVLVSVGNMRTVVVITESSQVSEAGR
jgi:hypothetical protein